jgi:hypothetical protein
MTSSATCKYHINDNNCPFVVLLDALAGAAMQFSSAARIFVGQPVPRWQTLRKPPLRGSITKSSQHNWMLISARDITGI